MSFDGLNWADGVICTVLVASVIISLMRGFVREAISLATWILAFWVAMNFVNPLAVLLSRYIQTPVIQMVAAFAVLFVATLLLGALVNFIISQLVKKTGLSGTDRLLGVVFGLGRGALLIALLLLVVSLGKISNDAWWQNSTFIPYFKPLALWIKDFLPQDINFNIPTRSV